jgi:hypothetical protein
VVEVGDGAGLGQVDFGLARPGHQPAVGHLDRHRAVDLFVVGEVDQPEAALAE